MIFLTGDTHGRFGRIEEFCTKQKTTRDDVLIILGDAGLNFWRDLRDKKNKARVDRLPVTTFCIHGNHEERPENVPGYQLQEWRGGQVWVQPEYPGVLFARDGEIYDFDGRKAIAIGGAYSVDKWYRIMRHLPWFSTEQPDEETKARVESALDRADWKVDYVLTHTVPRSAMPVHAFLQGIDQSSVDNSTEDWLEQIEKKLDYSKWYAGHFHVSWQCDRIRILYEDYHLLGE